MEEGDGQPPPPPPHSQPAARNISSFTAYGYPVFSTGGHDLVPPTPALAARPPPPPPLASAVGANRKTRPPLPRDDLLQCIAVVCGAIIVSGLMIFATNSWIAGASGHTPSVDVELESFSVSNLTISDNQISGNWTIVLNLTNPNRDLTVVYEDIKVEVFYSNDTGPSDGALSSEEITNNNYTGGQQLVQKPKKNTEIYLVPAARMKDLDNGVADSMIRSVILDGVMEFDMHLRVQLEFLDWSNTEVEFSMVYPRIKVPISPSNSTPMNAAGAAFELPDPHPTGGDYL